MSWILKFCLKAAMGHCIYLSSWSFFFFFSVITSIDWMDISVLAAEFICDSYIVVNVGCPRPPEEKSYVDKCGVTNARACPRNLLCFYDTFQDKSHHLNISGVFNRRYCRSWWASQAHNKIFLKLSAFLLPVLNTLFSAFLVLVLLHGELVFLCQMHDKG